MSIVFLILEMFLFFLLALLIMLLALILTKITVFVRYDKDGLFIKLKVFKIPIKIFPQNKKAIKKEVIKQKEQVEQTEPEKEKKQKPSKQLKIITKLVSNIVSEAIKILSRIKIEQLSIVSVVGGNDPYKIGVETGRRWAAFGALFSVLDIKQKSYSVVPNFAGQDVSSEYIIAVSTRIVFALGSGIRILRDYIKLSIAEKQLEKQIKKQLEQNI